MRMKSTLCLEIFCLGDGGRGREADEAEEKEEQQITIKRLIAAGKAASTPLCPWKTTATLEN